MDMSNMSPELPWLDQPVLLHSSRKDTCKLTPQQCAYRSRHWVYWYQADYVYGHATIYFICAVVGVFAVANLLSRYTPSPLAKNRHWKQAQAPFRYASYKTFRIESLRWWSPSLGILLLGLAGTVYFFGLTLGPKPYYWPNTKTLSYGSSPPIATRSGWMALALLPFVLALSAKANIVTALTGIPHEKLQVFHHWTSYAMFVLALVHTFPFIVFHIWKGDMQMQWEMSVEYWSGVAALVPQAYLTLMSIGPIRNRYYEFFKSTHYLAAVLFVIFFFIHCDFRLTSWDYFIAAGSIYFSSFLYAQARTYLKYGINRATLHLLPHGVVKVTIPVRASWTPGQHVFVRFLTLGAHSLTTHPFTICSLPTMDNSKSPLEMDLYIKPTGGITARLAKLARRQPNISVRVLLDGPYGGLNHGTLNKYDKVLLIAGGSGAGFTLPLIEDVLRHHSAAAGSDPPDKRTVKQLQVVVAIATPTQEAAEWYASCVDEIRSSATSLDSDTLHVNIHVTGPEPKKLKSTALGEELGAEFKDAQVSVSSRFVQYRNGRPNLQSIVQGITIGSNSSVGVAVCGPSSMLYDVRNAVAEAQVRAIQGRGAAEVYLHTEHFSW